MMFSIPPAEVGGIYFICQFAYANQAEANVCVYKFFIKLL